jgi:hypothetical protein
LSCEKFDKNCEHCTTSMSENKQQEEVDSAQAEAVPMVTDDIRLGTGECKEDVEDRGHGSPTPDDYLAISHALCEGAQGEQEEPLASQMEVWLRLQEEYHNIMDNSSSSSGKDNRRQWFVDNSFVLAHELLFQCFGDYQFRFTETNGVTIGHIRHALLWWLDSNIRDCICDLLCRRVPLQSLDKSACDVAGAKWKQLCNCTHIPRCGTIQAHALGHIIEYEKLRPEHERHDDYTIQAAREIELLDEMQFLDVFNSKSKQLQVFVEAAITLMLFIRDDRSIQALQYDSVADFVDDTYTLENERLVATTNKKGKTSYPRFDKCLEEETKYLFYTSNMMRIMNTFILGPGNKDRFMDIASHVVERKSYQTGGGNARGAKRRETLYALISGAHLKYVQLVCS